MPTGVERTSKSPDKKRRIFTSEIERKARAKRVAKLVERVVRTKEGEPYRYSRVVDHPFAKPRVFVEGRRRTVGPLTFQVWTETTISYGVGSDDLATFKTQSREFEVREKFKGREVTMFKASADMQADYEGGPLRLTVDPKDWTWYLLADVKRGTWEVNLEKLATPPAQKLAAS